MIDKAGLFTGEVATDFDENDKPVFVHNICKRMNIGMNEVFHIGDSRSDFLLFEAAGLSIAFNGTPQAKEIAQVSIDATSLLEILPLVLELEHTTLLSEV